MSHVYYTELWLATRKDLEKLLQLERKVQEGVPMKKKEILDATLSMYIRYKNIYYF